MDTHNMCRERENCEMMKTNYELHLHAAICVSAPGYEHTRKPHALALMMPAKGREISFIFTTRASGFFF